MATGKNSFASEISKMLQEKLQREADKAFEAYKKEAVEKFERDLEDKRAELIASVALRVSRQFEINSQADVVTISVRKDA